MAEQNTNPSTTRSVPAILKPLLHRTRSDPRPVVLMTCGISGAGKSTLSKLVCTTYPTFARLSIDTLVHSSTGGYNPPYNPSTNPDWIAKAQADYDSQLLSLLTAPNQQHDVVLDRSFFAKEDRDRFKAVIEREGGRWVLVYLKASKEVLWRRIQERWAEPRHADSANEITREILEGYWEGWEAPVGEGEVVVEVT